MSRRTPRASLDRARSNRARLVRYMPSFVRLGAIHLSRTASFSVARGGVRHSSPANAISAAS